MSSASLRSFAAVRACLSSSRHGTDKYVGIDSDLHFRPAQPLAAASWISSRVAIFLLLSFSRPRKLSIFPAGRIALSDTRPPR